MICRLREVQPDYWNSLQAVFSNAHDSFNETESSTASERFINFFSLLHQEMGVNILSAFSDAEKRQLLINMVMRSHIYLIKVIAKLKSQIGQM